MRVATTQPSPSTYGSRGRHRSFRRGWTPTQPTAWLAEGLLIYLTAAEAGQLLDRVTELSAPGSQVAFEHGGVHADALRTQAQQMPTMAEYAALWKDGIPNAADWLTDHGWQPQAHNLTAVADRYGRSIAGPTTGGFITATAQ